MTTSMTADGVIAAAQHVGVSLRVDDDGAIRARPPGRLSPALRATIREHKIEIVAALRRPPLSTSPLGDRAASITPRVHLTITTTDDHDADLDHLRAIMDALRAAPGGNRVVLRICDRGEVAHLEYRVLASRGLRRTIADLLRQRAGHGPAPVPPRRLQRLGASRNSRLSTGRAAL